MAKSFHSLIPDVETLLSLEPEELAGVVMEYLHSRAPGENYMGFNRFNLFHESNRLFGEYPRERHEQIRDVVIEAWMWLVHQGLLVPRADDSSGNSFIFSRRGSQLRSAADVVAYRGQRILPREQLHPRIARDVWALFVRGKYDTAVFEAFKEVEVSVREASHLEDTDLGVDLVRKAFHEKNGPLRDRDSVPSERQAMAHLLAGAIGVFKNPHSHRHVALTDPHEAIEMIMLANHLLRIVDTAAGTKRGDSHQNANADAKPQSV